MDTVRPWQSAIGRVVGVLLIGGLAVSVGLSVLEWRRARAGLEMDLTQRATICARNLQAVLYGLGPETDRRAIESVLAGVVSDTHPISAARLRDGAGACVSVGVWPQTTASMSVWRLGDAGVGSRGRVALDRPTFVQAPFRRAGGVTELELLIDGPAAVASMHQRLLAELGTMWLLLAVVVLLGLLMMRRWLTGPLTEITQLVALDAGAAPFRRLAGRQRGQFAQLSDAIAEKLDRLSQANERLAQREHAFASLYQQAPTAMLSLDTDGRVIEANRRAAALFGAPSPTPLLGRRATELIIPEDRPLLEQTLERLTYHETGACELRALVAGQRVDCNLEAVADRDEDGALRSYRLALTDVSRSRALRRELENQTQLLNLVLNHMSDAIVLVDARGKVAAYNQQLASLLQHRPDQLAGRRFTHTEFWDALGVLNREQFVSRMRQIDAERDRPAQARFETRAGVFLFQGIPVHDVTGVPVGRLWVLQETTPQEHSQRLINQQNRQLQVLKETGAKLCDAVRLEPLVERAAKQMFEGIDVDALGIAVRTADGQRRCLQVIHRGEGAYLLEPNRQLAASVERDLMPRVLKSRDVALWTDLQVKTPWAEAARQAGLTSVAAVPLRGSSDAQGIIWIARRAGERLERHHIMLIETIAPLLAARLQLAQVAESLQRSDLTDQVTALPAREQMDHMLGEHARRPNQPCAVLCVHLMGFAQVNELLDHDGANAVLRRIGQRVVAVCRRGTFVSRESGPAFCILLPGASAGDAAKLGERVIAALTREHVEGPAGTRQAVAVSVGIGACPADGRNPFDARDAALARVALAKQRGQNQIVAEGLKRPDRAAS